VETFEENNPEDKKAAVPINRTAAEIISYG
jgi:hypothetical protein